MADPIVRQAMKTVKTELDKDKQEVAVLYVNGMIVRGGDKRPGVASAQKICKRKYTPNLIQLPGGRAIWPYMTRDWLTCS